MEQRIKSLEIETHEQSQLIFDRRGTKAIQGTNHTLSTNGAGTTGYPHAQKGIQT